jgi:hypothetical protein
LVNALVLHDLSVELIGYSGIQHALFGVTLDGQLHLAPINQDIRHVLDFATGMVGLDI